MEKDWKNIQIVCENKTRDLIGMCKVQSFLKQCFAWSSIATISWRYYQQIVLIEDCAKHCFKNECTLAFETLFSRSNNQETFWIRSIWQNHCANQKMFLFSSKTCLKNEIIMWKICVKNQLFTIFCNYSVAFVKCFK